MKILHHRFGNKRGFTLVELLAVMMILSILAAIAVPSYRRHQLKARETVLSENLYQMRRALDAFYADKGSYPDSLEDLTNSHYLRGIPRDPFTYASDSWECQPPEPTDDGELAEGGCFDVKSGSDRISTNGSPYNEW